jgi:hypothetical protein
MMRHRVSLVIACLAATVVVGFGLSACGGDAASSPPTPDWTPAPRVSAGYGSFEWGEGVDLRGKLLAKAWTLSSSFTLAGGPAEVKAELTAPGTTLPRFVCRPMPQQHAPGFAGYVKAR